MRVWSVIKIFTEILCFRLAGLCKNAYNCENIKQRDKTISTVINLSSKKFHIGTQKEDVMKIYNLSLYRKYKKYISLLAKYNTAYSFEFFMLC